MFKNMRLVILFDMLLNPSFKIPTSFANIARTTASTSKLYNNATEEIISDTSKFENLNEDPTLKRKASLERFLCKLKQKNFF